VTVRVIFFFDLVTCENWPGFQRHNLIITDFQAGRVFVRFRETHTQLNKPKQFNIALYWIDFFFFLLSFHTILNWMCLLKQLRQVQLYPIIIKFPLTHNTESIQSLPDDSAYSTNTQTWSNYNRIQIIPSALPSSSYVPVPLLPAYRSSAFW